MIQLVRKAPAPLAGHGLIFGVTYGAGTQNW